eukprot:scaffold13009_cov62-Phaeocystis_antarctica.AAC.1
MTSTCSTKGCPVRRSWMYMNAPSTPSGGDPARGNARKLQAAVLPRSTKVRLPMSLSIACSTSPRTSACAQSSAANSLSTSTYGDLNTFPKSVFPSGALMAPLTTGDGENAGSGKQATERSSNDIAGHALSFEKPPLNSPPTKRRPNDATTKLAKHHGTLRGRAARRVRILGGASQE